MDIRAARRGKLHGEDGRGRSTNDRLKKDELSFEHQHYSSMFLKLPCRLVDIRDSLLLRLSLRTDGG